MRAETEWGNYKNSTNYDDGQLESFLGRESFHINGVAYMQIINWPKTKKIVRPIKEKRKPKFAVVKSIWRLWSVERSHDYLALACYLFYTTKLAIHCVMQWRQYHESDLEWKKTGILHVHQYRRSLQFFHAHAIINPRIWHNSQSKPQSQVAHTRHTYGPKQKIMKANKIV